MTPIAASPCEPANLRTCEPRIRIRTRAHSTFSRALRFSSPALFSLVLASPPLQRPRAVAARPGRAAPQCASRPSAGVGSDLTRSDDKRHGHDLDACLGPAWDGRMDRQLTDWLPQTPVMWLSSAAAAYRQQFVCLLPAVSDDWEGQAETSDCCDINPNSGSTWALHGLFMALQHDT